GVIIFAATANANASTIEYPANSQYVVSVGAASPSGERKSPSSSDGEDWWGSNYGVNTQDARNAVDIMAPTILPATDISGSGGYQSGNYYLYFNGTSCATPYAAGVAALVLSADPSLSPAELRSILTSTATDMTIDGGTGWDRYTGYGMVNAYAALMALDPSLPDVSITAPANGSVLDLGDQINVTATASDGDGSITSVAFYLDDVLQFTDYSSPYQWTWVTSTSSAGNHRIKAIATDNDSNTFFSSILVSLVVPADEGFESGNFSAYPWINSSTSPWTVQNTDKYSGNYAAKSGTISNNAQTELSVTHYVNQAGNISFWYKVSSELNYDKLYFLIDGVEKNNWSGSINWTQVSYPVSVGTHTFTWRYSKDGSEFSGSDCAWIDHIIFPPLGAYYAPATNLSAIPADGSITLNWSSPGGSVQAFKVYRDDTLITTTSNTTFTDNSVSNGNSYSYYVIAVYAGGESEATTTITVVAGQVLEAILGSGTSTTGYSNASPINTYYRSLHGQSVYTKAELHSAGISGPINITQIGFDVVTLPNLALPSFIVRMKHTTDTDVTNWQSADDMQTVYGPLTYAPATGWDMLTLSTPFLWNGTDNIVIDTAFDRVATYSSSGTVHYSTVTNGYRYARSDGSNQTDVFSDGSTATTRPNLKLIFSPLSEDPEIVVSTSSLDFGNIRIYDTASQSFTISNSGGGTLEGSIACSGVFSVAEISGKKGLNRSSREVSRNTITYSIGEGSSKSFRVTFDPVTTGETTGTITITHNSDGADKSISLAGEAYNPVPDTPVPTNAATNVNPNQVLSWTNDGTVTAVDVYVGTSEYNLIKVADQQSDPLNSYTSPTAWTYQTTYYWKVVAHNSSIYSGESAVFSFTTIADPTLTPPFTEEFGSFPPTNWTRFSGALAENSSLSSTTSGWVADGFANVGSTGSAKINVYGENRYYWLVSPSINLDAGKANYQLSFDLALTEWNATTGPETDGTDDKFAVVISTDDGATWSSSNTLALWDNAGTSSVYNNISYTGENIVVPLSSYSGSVKIAFYAESSSSNADNDLFVDNVSVSAIPVSPIFSVSPGSKDFGTLLVGQNMQQDFVISNIGTGSLGITEVALQNSD
ncbi:MAG: S8 family serine peptidase, partial [Candidatus Cloacimonadaceae bacterium]|nr:S8 family serine peptidase [Candidatus Cloacimonadaceae bacterium]